MFICLFRRAIFVSGLLLAGTVEAAAPAADTAELARQREQFPLVWEAARHLPDDGWRRLAPGLETYPLFPYLELAALQRRIAEVKRREVDKFLAAWPDSLPAQTLRDAFLLELARRSDWKDFLALLPPTTPGRELQCDAFQARLALGQPLDFKRDVEPLWLTPVALPSACDAAVHWARDHGKLSTELIWKRIDLAARAGTAGLVTALAAMLDGAERNAAERIALATGEPARALDDAAVWTDTPRTREAVALAFERLARRNSELAETQWAKLESRFHLDAEQRGSVLRALAIYRATSYAPDALARLEALPAALTDDTTREWRVRVALATQDFGKTLAAIEAMPPTQQADPRWRYLRARMLVKLDREKDATPLLSTLAQEANFHGFLAADWLQQPYAICPDEFAVDATQQAALRSLLARAFEFFALDRLAEARREWDFAMPRLDAAKKRAAADLASDIGWYDRAVYTLNQGDDLHLYTLRFPLARRDQIVRAANSAGIDPAWAYAIIRAESAWTTDAHSGADAWGLMQLLPGTAAQLAKANKVRYGGARDLLDPDINITLGTRYLSDMALHYDGSPWLASAAYNAGVDPVGRWIDARDALEPDFFIETIPYKETREYVSRVLAFSVIYDWRLHGTVLPMSSKLPRIGSAYESPAADAPRKAVVCAPRQSVTADTQSTAPTNATAQHR
ncbi:MAG TPA: transglycosylase SLT domain-containing protein [Rudaea sp.]|jgi:soluble lytic murein transglycosylase